MPRAAIAAEVADVVLPVPTSPRGSSNSHAHQRHAGATDPSSRAQVARPDDEAALGGSSTSCARARATTSRATSGPTILRRLARRMQLNHRDGFDDYLALLRENPEEIQALFDDLLISVTTFFRDPAAWEALRTQVVVPLVERAPVDESIRVWVPGCATGEEAYTLAILFREEISRRDIAREFVIFGSDVDQGALATAREGLYPAAIAADVSEARLARYFRVEGDHYRVTNEIRDCVVFALHSVLRDPPFSKLHLISCRNVLIYLDRELQQQLQKRFPLRPSRRRLSLARRFRDRRSRPVRAHRQAEPAFSARARAASDR